jgi:polyisoprenoid-binding protein YceI
MHGELTVRGVTQPLTVAVEPTGAQGRRVRARATATIDRYAFGLVKVKGMAARRVTLEIDVTATRN